MDEILKNGSLLDLDGKDRRPFFDAQPAPKNPQKSLVCCENRIPAA
jgi:hypothetical protein